MARETEIESERGSVVVTLIGIAVTTFAICVLCKIAKTVEDIKSKVER